ncbi:hypothetical protein SKAU_G00155900 [Synaphobranchus kaupii]|uniref:Uncharacterized protein n=1 Tax=Synaphobranchus kaupii TaxID=118154 RepID=A0A9Q1FHK3_SYNKA|nr:hypothetical protein SKAU_G00155900 [Synaphobranchus kaupii]
MAPTLLTLNHSNSKPSVSLSSVCLFLSTLGLSLTSVIHNHLIALGRLFHFFAKLGRQFPDTMAEAP